MFGNIQVFKLNKENRNIKKKLYQYTERNKASVYSKSQENIGLAPT